MPSISSSFSFSPIPRSIRRLPRRASMELIPIPPISSLISCFQAVIRLISRRLPVCGSVFPQVQDSAWRSPSYTCRFDTCGRDDTQEPEARLLQHNRRPLQGLLLLPHRKRCGYCRLLRAKRDFGFLHHEASDPLPPERALQAFHCSVSGGASFLRRGVKASCWCNSCCALA